MMLGRRPKTNAQRFWSQVKQGDGCWEWLSWCDRDGYGQFKFRVSPKRYITHRAPRVAYELTYGPARGLNVLHKCDNPKCVRPDHLELGTQSKNITDCQARGRLPVRLGSANMQSKLTEASVAEIRKIYLCRGIVTQKELAQEYKVAQSVISEVLSRKAWTHVAT